MKKFFTKQRFFLLLIAIVLGALVLRIHDISVIPPGVNRDEAAIGYTAYSLLKTGKDEYGIAWPISFKSFGDWKLPLYIYLTIAPVAAFGLSEFSVRLVSVLAGTVTVLLTALLVRLLFSSHKSRDALALFSALLLAVSPWHIHFSRVGAEANLAVFFMTLGLVFFFASHIREWFLVLSSFSFAATLYTYHGNHIFTPLFVIGLLTLYWKTVIKNRYFWVSMMLGFVLAVGIFAQTLTHADTTKISGIHLLSDPSFVHEMIDKMRVHHALSPISAVVHNKLVLGISEFATRFIRAYSPEFLYFVGGGNKAHNIPHFGNAHLVELPFLLLGVALLISRRSREHLLFLMWFFLAAMAPSITKDAPHSARMLSVLPAMPIIVAYGYIEIRSRWKNMAVPMCTAIVLLLSVVTYLDAYFIHFPILASRDWGSGYKQVAQYLQQEQGKYTSVVFARTEYSPYIFLAFYNKMDPKIIQHAERYKETSEGFSHVSKMQNIEFRTPDYSIVPGRLIVEWTMDVPPLSPAVAHIHTIAGLDGEPHLSVVSWKEEPQKPGLEK